MPYDNQQHLRVRLIISPGQEDLARGSKAGQVVHMSSGVLVGKEPDWQPDNLGHAQQLLQIALNLLSAQLGVAGTLGLAQQALLCGKQSPELHASMSDASPASLIQASRMLEEG